MQIIPLVYGETTLSEKMIFINGDAGKYRDILLIVYLIKADDKTILVDAGCETMPGFDVKNFIGPVKALEKVKINADDITDVVITHSHHDHIECVKYFKNAVIHIENDEYEKGKKYIPDNFKVNVFKGEFKLTDDVAIIKIGGHSKGSCIVEIVDNDKIYVISGDECYLSECLIKKVPTGCFCNEEKSRNFIEKYSDEKYTVLLCHDK